MDLYAEHILDHYRRPRGKDALPQVSITHQVSNPTCGDDLQLSLLIHDGRIAGVSWQGSGCAISQAAMSMLYEELAGMSVEEAQSLQPETIYSLLGVPIGIRREKCALLCLHALRNALHVWKREPEEGWNHILQ